MTTHAIASSAGLTFAFYVFLAFAGLVAVLVYVLLTRPSARRIPIGAGVRKTVAVPVAVLIWVALFSAIYFSSLSGFHGVVVGETGVRIEYAVPSRSFEMRYDEIDEVVQRPAFRMQWRIEISTRTGSRFESAPGARAAIQAAADEINRRR